MGRFACTSVSFKEGTSIELWLPQRQRTITQKHLGITRCQKASSKAFTIILLQHHMPYWTLSCGTVDSLSMELLLHLIWPTDR